MDSPVSADRSPNPIYSGSRRLKNPSERSAYDTTSFDPEELGSAFKLIYIPVDAGLWLYTTHRVSIRCENLQLSLTVPVSPYEQDYCSTRPITNESGHKTLGRDNSGTPVD